MSDFSQTLTKRLDTISAQISELEAARDRLADCLGTFDERLEDLGRLRDTIIERLATPASTDMGG